MKPLDGTSNGRAGSMKTRGRELAWFAGLWLAGVGTLSAIAGLLRWLMKI